MSSDSDHTHEQHSWQAEKSSAYLYRILSDAESGTPRQLLFLELAKAADEQARLWASEMRKLGSAPPPTYVPDLRTRLVGWLIPRLGPHTIHPVLAAMKVRGMSLYAGSLLPQRSPPRLSGAGKQRRDFGGNPLRAILFGINDGLVSNISLILGVAGASSNNGVILLCGLAGLLAGAFSVAAGEFISVRSQREMVEYQISLERAELDQHPQQEAAELALIFVAKGLEKEAARQRADNIIADPDRALDILAREELGLNTDEPGSPPGAALFAFCTFAAGAAIPLLPFLFGGPHSLTIAIGLSGLALFGVGAALSLFSGRHALLGGLRMLAIGSAAGGGTFLIGSALGVMLSLV